MKLISCDSFFLSTVVILLTKYYICKVLSIKKQCNFFKFLFENSYTFLVFSRLPASVYEMLVYKMICWVNSITLSLFTREIYIYNIIQYQIYQKLHLSSNLNLFWRCTLSNTFSLWGEILYGIPEGLVLWPLLFNIFLYYLFYVLEDTNIANYVDDNTLYIAVEAPDA